MTRLYYTFSINYTNHKLYFSFYLIFVVSAGYTTVVQLLFKGTIHAASRPILALMEVCQDITVACLVYPMRVYDSFWSQDGGRHKKYHNSIAKKLWDKFHCYIKCVQYKKVDFFLGSVLNWTKVATVSTPAALLSDCLSTNTSWRMAECRVLSASQPCSWKMQEAPVFSKSANKDKWPDKEVTRIIEFFVLFYIELLICYGARALVIQFLPASFVKWEGGGKRRKGFVAEDGK